ncbi:hypothetical protein NEOC65_000113 [Neochlamydia sp. AcF65]|nr:hypothetical protein [Neochlamydia sp. AcF65]
MFQWLSSIRKEGLLGFVKKYISEGENIKCYLE